MLVKSLSTESGISIGRSRAKTKCSNSERTFIYTTKLRGQKVSEVLGWTWGKHSFLFSVYYVPGSMLGFGNTKMIRHNTCSLIIQSIVAKLDKLITTKCGENCDKDHHRALQEHTRWR